MCNFDPRQIDVDHRLGDGSGSAARSREYTSGGTRAGAWNAAASAADAADVGVGVGDGDGARADARRRQRGVDAGPRARHASRCA